jgi:cation:H+ antiporter
MFRIPTFIVSLVLISVGTNIPELSIGIRAILAKRKGIAFGNYVGSAAFNTLQLGVLSVLHKQTAPANGSNYSVLLYALGLIFFMYFAKSKNQLSRKEGFFLFTLYIILIVCEFLTGPGWSIG